MIAPYMRTRQFAAVEHIIGQPKSKRAMPAVVGALQVRLLSVQLSCTAGGARCVGRNQIAQFEHARQ